MDTVHRGYDLPFVREALDEYHVDYVVPKVRRHAKMRRHKLKVKTALGPRWQVERTNSWLTNFDQPRRVADRKLVHDSPSSPSRQWS